VAVAGSTWTRTPRSANRTGGHGLDAKVDGGNAEPGLAVPAVVLGFHHIRFVDADLFGQAGAFHRGAGQDGINQFLVRGLRSFTGEDAGAHGLVLAQVAGDGAGVHALDSDDPLRHQFLVQ
jgi:hypothetical protein